MAAVTKFDSHKTELVNVFVSEQLLVEVPDESPDCD
jgi:hypothetical protein